MKTGRKILGTLAIPAITAAVLLLLCAANGKHMIANRTSFNYFMLYTAIVMITTMALSINLNSGRFDFSLGAMAVLSSVLSSRLSYAVLAGGTGSAGLMLVFSILIGGLLGAVSGFVYVMLRIPPIITSLGVTLIYEGITFTVTGGKYVMTEVRNASMTTFAGNWYWSLLLILAVLAIVIYFFDRTKFGYDYRALQFGQKVAVNTGIREVPNALWCYIFCGALMGIVGFLNAARSSNINGGSLNFGSIGIMFTAFLPMFIGGYIGRYSNDKLGYLIAAVCMSMLNSTFAAFSNEISASMQSIINAVLLVVFLIYLNNERLLKKLFSSRKTEP
ncbi:MAG: sugar ABC transporter permease [Acutalibacteraceae bacterium]|nr:sugar ABC transporter permease [Acutalibacteraceae bacterium]